MTSHNLAWKEKQCAGIKDLVKNYQVIGLVSLSRTPSELVQKLRKKLHGKAVLRVSKVRVIKKALKEAGVSGADGFDKFLDGNVALICTNMNPFELFATLKRNKNKAFPKEGSLAEADIVVPAGDTGLPPGPALTDLKNAGLKARVQGATIAIPEDTVVTKKGEPVSKAVVSTLQKLNIKPIKIGVNLIAVLENGQLFLKDILDINSEETYNIITLLSHKALNLAIEISYLTKTTLPILITKAFNKAKNLSFNAGIVNKETLPLFLAKANSQANALNKLVDFSKVPAQTAPAAAEPAPAAPAANAENKPLENK